MLITRLRVLSAMILREMTTRYGRSAGGYIWAVIEPVAFVALLSLLFSQITRVPAHGPSFPLFFATGVIAFFTYRDIAETTSSAVKVNKSLFTYPHVTALDAILARFLLQFLTQIVVALVVFTGIFLFEDLQPQLDFAPIIMAMGLGALLGLGIGTLNCSLFTLMPTWQRFFNLINRPLFLISGIFFTPESLPADIREYIFLNPLVHVIGLMRRGFYPSYTADYVNFPLLIGLPAGFIVLGLFLLWRYELRLLEQ